LGQDGAKRCAGKMKFFRWSWGALRNSHEAKKKDRKKRKKAISMINESDEQINNNAR
jgi:hypothetical protein